MATLDLEQQEQLDALKHFWERFGNLITWVLIVVLGAYAAWNGWDYWERRQGAQASALYSEVERSALDGDLARLQRVVSDMKNSYGSTAYASQSALLAARILSEQGEAAPAMAELDWVSKKGSDDGLRAIARLRLASLQMGQGDHAAALQTLSASFPPEFTAVAADRRGDALLLQGKRAEAAAEYGKAYEGLGALGGQYQQLVGIKLNALGVNPDAAPGRGAS